jgi:hypothetical protein
MHNYLYSFLYQQPEGENKFGYGRGFIELSPPFSEVDIKEQEIIVQDKLQKERNTPINNLVIVSVSDLGEVKNNFVPALDQFGNSY